jgi:hypothetical protein
MSDPMASPPSPQISQSTLDAKLTSDLPEPDQGKIESLARNQSLGGPRPEKRKSEDIHPEEDAEEPCKRLRVDGEGPKRLHSRDKGKNSGRGKYLYVWRASTIR